MLFQTYAYLTIAIASEVIGTSLLKTTTASRGSGHRC
jgi:multidrug transporter EmrE-like cation transporter